MRSRVRRTGWERWPLAPYRQLEGGADGTAQRLDRPLHGPIRGGQAIDLGQLVAGPDARPLAGRPGHRRHDGDPPVAGVDLEPDAAVVAGGALLQPLVVLPRQERGVRIVQLLEQAVDGPAIELALGQRVHLVVAHVLEHLLEQARLLIDVIPDAEAPLEEPSAGGAGEKGQGCRQGPACRHEVPRSAAERSEGSDRWCGQAPSLTRMPIAILHDAQSDDGGQDDGAADDSGIGTTVAAGTTPAASGHLPSVPPPKKFRSAGVGEDALHGQGGLLPQPCLPRQAQRSQPQRAIQHTIIRLERREVPSHASPRHPGAPGR